MVALFHRRSRHGARPAHRHGECAAGRRGDGGDHRARSSCTDALIRAPGRGFRPEAAMTEDVREWADERGVKMAAGASPPPPQREGRREEGRRYRSNLIQMHQLALSWLSMAFT